MEGKWARHIDLGPWTLRPMAPRHWECRKRSLHGISRVAPPLVIPLTVIASEVPSRYVLQQAQGGILDVAQPWLPIAPGHQLDGVLPCLAFEEQTERSE